MCLSLANVNFFWLHGKVISILQPPGLTSVELTQYTMRHNKRPGSVNYYKQRVFTVTRIDAKTNKTEHRNMEKRWPACWTVSTVYSISIWYHFDLWNQPFGIIATGVWRLPRKPSRLVSVLWYQLQVWHHLVCGYFHFKCKNATRWKENNHKNNNCTSHAALVLLQLFCLWGAQPPLRRLVSPETSWQPHTMKPLFVRLCAKSDSITQS